MKTVSLLLRMIAVLGALAAVALFVMTQGKIENLLDEQRQMTSAKEEMSNQLDELNTARNELEGRVRSLDSDLASTRTEYTNARSQLAQNRRDMTAVQTDLRRAREEVKNLEGQNTSLKEEIVTMRAAVPDVDSNKVEEYQDRIAQLSRRVEELQGQLVRQPATTDTTTEVDPALVATETETPAETGEGPKTSSVLRTNPSMGMLVISSGVNQGLKDDMEFQLAQELGPKIKVRLSNVQPDISVATILPGQGKVRFEEGKLVTLYLN